jgi:hypothetical protein
MSPYRISRSSRLHVARWGSAVAVGILFLVIGPASATTYPPLTNPSTNIAPNPNFLSSGNCTGSPGAYTCENPCVSASLTWTINDDSPSCANYLATAIDNADAIDGAQPMYLPSNWQSLTEPERIFVMIDLERIDHGYPPYLGMNADLDAAAQSAANARTDPYVPSSFALGVDSMGYSGFGGAWAGANNVLSADYFWMYSDGWDASTNSSFNIDCTSATAPACWGHRDELLGWDPAFNPGVGLDCTTCEMGAGAAIVSSYGSYTALVALPAGAPPPMTFTWEQELPYLGPSATTTTTSTTSTSTTTTSTVPTSTSTVPVSTELRVHAFGGRLAHSRASLRWRVTGTGDVGHATLSVFARAGCRSLVAARSIAFAPPGPTHGTIVLTARGLSVSGRSYFARLRVVSHQGATAVSGCVSLGRPRA